MNNTVSVADCQQMLTENILPFWMTKMVDRQQGGFYGRIDGHDQLHEDAPKGIILNARILWTFSAAFRAVTNPDYLITARRAYEYILAHFIDRENGGVYWMLNADGTALDTKKQVYAQAFTIYALAEYYAITKEKAALDLAIELFELTERYSFDSKENGYLEAFDKEWNLLEDLRLSDKDANEAKTMNTHLHVLEAYTNLYRYWQSDLLTLQLTNLIQLFLDRFIDEKGHFHLFFDENWNLKSNECSYGHDIEGGWLLQEAAEVLGDESLISQTKKAALRLTSAALEGMDADGGLMNDGDADQVHDTDKHWWPQAEALVGLINAYEVSGDESYWQQLQQTWLFINDNLVDEKAGEWFWMVSKAGIVNKNEDKAGPWKCPYHNGRAMLELMTRIDRLG